MVELLKELTKWEGPVIVGDSYYNSVGDAIENCKITAEQCDSIILCVDRKNTLERKNSRV